MVHSVDVTRKQTHAHYLTIWDTALLVWFAFFLINLIWNYGLDFPVNICFSVNFLKNTTILYDSLQNEKITQFNFVQFTIFY